MLKAIRGAELISRMDLPALTGLSAGTITQVTSDLLARGLIVERKTPAKGRGRPRTFLEIAAEGAIVIGANLTDHGSISLTFVDLAGVERFSRDLALPTPPDLPGLAAQVCDAIEQAIVASGVDRASILHVGIGLPAIVDSIRGAVHFLMFFPSAPFPFADAVSDRLRVPVTVENDTNCLARAEHWFGSAQDIGTFTLIHVGYAVSSAQYEGGIARTGAHGFTPELGHTKTDYGPLARPCYCGGEGCASAYVSMFGLFVGSGRSTQSRFPRLRTIDKGFADLLDDAARGENLALRLFEEAGEHLGRLVANHVNAADPGTVLITMPDARMRGLIEPGFERALRRHTMPGLDRSTQVRFSVAMPDWREKGTAALALEQAYLGSERG
ncbi:MAG TPA: ROK family transcriptional regulator [Novosphingobium sp.]|nr:ROK family transcriptional regulator [Novosphingobium sp.]